MSLVVFPFKSENPKLVLKNAQVAAAHPRVQEVLCVSAEEEETFQAVADAREYIQHITGTPVQLIVQERLGQKRPGKGDALNTALKYFVEETAWQRIHFYDADVTSFGEDWITKAEEAAEYGYDVVRHGFPRARTEGLISWFITRTGFALIWPKSVLPRIQQPLAGEFLFQRRAAEALYEDPRVLARSDWGVDTVYTFVAAQRGFPTFETYERRGKQHRGTPSLYDLRHMVVESFASLQELRHEQLPGDVMHRAEAADTVPDAIREQAAFDVESTIELLQERWTPRQIDLLDLFPATVREGMAKNRERPRFTFMSEDYWAASYEVLLEHFDETDQDWAELLFKLWAARVLNYTTLVALRGFYYSQRYLRDMLERYLRRQPSAAFAGDGTRRTYEPAGTL